MSFSAILPIQLDIMASDMPPVKKFEDIVSHPALPPFLSFPSLSLLPKLE